MIRTVISEADLEDKTREIVERVRHGGMAVLEDSGEEQIVLLDAADFRLLRALAACATESSELDGEISFDTQVLRDYLDDEISLGKAAEELGLSHFVGGAVSPSGSSSPPRPRPSPLAPLPPALTSTLERGTPNPLAFRVLGGGALSRAVVSAGGRGLG